MCIYTDIKHKFTSYCSGRDKSKSQTTVITKIDSNNMWNDVPF